MPLKLKRFAAIRVATNLQGRSGSKEICATFASARQRRDFAHKGNVVSVHATRKRDSPLGIGSKSLEGNGSESAVTDSARERRDSTLEEGPRTDNKTLPPNGSESTWMP